ncbi:MAG: hypothetical protein SGILL_004801 [Bacillariaceae sp.]
MGTTVRLVRECPDELEQHGFNEKSMALTPIALVVSAASLRYVLTILLDLVKAYDLVQRDQIMDVVDEEHSVETAAMVATLLQTSTVMTKGDLTKLKQDIEVGVTQGGPAIVKVAKDPAPMKGYADDIALQLASDVAAAISLRAAGGWAIGGLMRFNLGVGKSLELIEIRMKMMVQRMLGGEALRGSHSDNYLGVSLNARGATSVAVDRRVDGASATLASLTLSKSPRSIPGEFFFPSFSDLISILVFITKNVYLDQCVFYSIFICGVDEVLFTPNRSICAFLLTLHKMQF